MATTTDFQVLVNDSVTNTVVSMFALDATAAIKSAPTRYTLVTSSLAMVAPIPGITQAMVAAEQPFLFPRNAIDGGDLSTNPWQRGTTFAAIANTPTYTADRWVAKGGASSSINVSKQAITAVPAFTQSLRFRRTAANTDTTFISIAQIMEGIDATRLQGQQVTLSFWAVAGPNFSSLGGALNIQVAAGTVLDEGNAAYFTGTWTGFATLPAVVGQTAPILSTTWTRYFVSFVVPVNALELGVSFGFTPVGTAGAADDFSLIGVQLEAGLGVSNFEHRDVFVELEACQRYCWVVNEPASGIAVGGGYSTSTTQANIALYPPIQMRAAPTVSFGGTALGATTFKIGDAALPIVLAAPFLAAGTGHSPNAINIAATTAASQTVGRSVQLQGAGGGSSIIASADL